MIQWKIPINLPVILSPSIVWIERIERSIFARCWPVKPLLHLTEYLQIHFNHCKVRIEIEHTMHPPINSRTVYCRRGLGMVLNLVFFLQHSPWNFAHWNSQKDDQINGRSLLFLPSRYHHNSWRLMRLEPTRNTTCEISIVVCIEMVLMSDSLNSSYLSCQVHFHPWIWSKVNMIFFQLW